MSSAVSGLAFYPGGSYPSNYDGALFFSDYSRACIWVIFAGAGGVPNPGTVQLLSTQTPSVGLQAGPNGDIFYVDHLGGSIMRITAANGVPTAVVSASPLLGVAPLTVDFNGSGSSDPDSDPLAYAWDLDGDGQFDDASTATAQFVYQNSGSYVVTLRVDDGRGGIDTDQTTITVNSAPVGDGFLDLPGVSGVFVSAPDAARLDLTGDLDIRADVAMASWTSYGKFIAKLDNTSGYELMTNLSTGQLRLAWRNGGGTVFFPSSTVALPASPGQRLQVRATLDVNNGSGGHTVTFYYRTNTALALSDHSGWTQLGTPIVRAGTTNIGVGVSPLALGSGPSGTTHFWSGEFYQGLVLNGIGAAGTVVANPDFRSTGQLVSTPPNYSQWVDSVTNPFTVNGSGWSYNPG